MFSRNELPQLLFAGASDQEKASKANYGAISQYNPTAGNRYDSANLMGYNDLKGAADKYTKAGVDTIKKDTATAVNQAGQGTAAGAQSRGFGGSILEDMIAKSKAKTQAGGTNAIRDLMMKRLGMEPGLINQGNQTLLQKTAGAQGADFQNIQNMMSKFGLAQGAIGGLDDSTWLDDALAVGNTAANVASAFV